VYILCRYVHTEHTKYFPSSSPRVPLVANINMVGVFEYEVDKMGSCFTKSWEWK
jgi:hypothetical protein